MPQNQILDSIVVKGFWLAGAYNIFGVLLFSKFFTNSLLSSLDPAVFSSVGLIAIILWGLAYCSIAKSYQSSPYLVLVFFIEKILYTTTWLMWLSANGNTLPSIDAESPLTATFYSIYGAGDFIFAIFFLWTAIRCLRKQEAA
jgi:hypothetical protein